MFCRSLSVAARLAVLSATAATVSSAHAQGTISVQLQDYVAMPLSGTLTATADNAPYAARVNFLREEPGGGLNRFWVCDLNGKLYILDQTTKQFATYLDFQRNTSELPGATGLFPAFTRAAGYANGLVTFQFDPEYRVAGSPNYGKFYTVHIETDTNDGAASRLPNASAFPGFTNASSYTATNVNEAPGTDNTSTRQAVLIEWQDTNPADTTFQGTARELLRIEFNGRIHPMGDLLFNPLATTSAHADWRKLYIAVGDGGAGEQNNPALHPTPQRLDTLQGKILRILPDAPSGSSSLRYTIPADNPFVGSALSPTPRGEIYAYGFRNPHRISWDAATDLLIATDIGYHSWEEVNIVHRGANHGWADREGTYVYTPATGLANTALPANDAANNTIYPVIQYAHSTALGFGDAIAGGFVYRGTRVPQLTGKYVFGDITTGQIFWANLADLIAADDGNPATLAPFYRLELLWSNPRNALGLQAYDRAYEIIASEYHARGGPDTDLPGSATVSDLTGGGRADIRLAVDAAGELYLTSKSDGMIRALIAAPAPATAPVISKQPVAQTIATGATVVFSVEATGAASYQWKRGSATLTGATGATFTLTGATAADAGNYTVDAINATGTTTSTAAALSVSAAAVPGHLSNLSIRAAAGTGAQTLTVGFVLGGAFNASFDRELYLRAVGPTLTPFGVTGALPDPKLSLYRGSTLLSTVDNWSDLNPTTVDTTSTRFGAFALATGSKDAASVQSSLTRNAYTMQATSAVAGQSGVVLAEVYDLGAPSGTFRQLTNVSARTSAGLGENTLIAGFVIGGTTARTVLVRAAGPALTTFGVTGVLADPKLALYRGSDKIAESDNWSTSADLVGTFASVGAFDFVARSKDAVLYLTLAPGAYTAQVTGPGTTTGVALVEIYVLP
jgi:hypothetical protein